MGEADKEAQRQQQKQIQQGGGRGECEKGKDKRGTRRDGVEFKRSGDQKRGGVEEGG